jgi:hypothetical protein
MKEEQAVELVKAINQMSLEHSEESMQYLRQLLLEMFGKYPA